jgi:hypothetical protein
MICIKSYNLISGPQMSVLLPYAADILTIVNNKGQHLLIARVMTNVKSYERKMLCLLENEEFPAGVCIHDYEYVNTVVDSTFGTTYTYYIKKDYDN